MTKPLILLLSLTVFSLITKSQTNYVKNKIVTIEYQNKINDFSVNVIWKPNLVEGSYTKGPAIIEFYNEKVNTSFTLTNNHFGILNGKLPFSYSEDGSKIMSLDQNEIQLFYLETNMKGEDSFGSTDEPFFFQDVDFDDIEELIIGEIANGKRFVKSFKVYKIEYGYIQSDLDYFTNSEPFKSLDVMSKIDYANKRIINYSYSGSSCDNYEIYKAIQTEDSIIANYFYLETIIEQEFDEDLFKHYELRYKVIEETTKQLISKKEIFKN